MFYSQIFLLIFQMKSTTYHQLSKSNTVFIKYNMLIGIENLGMADCNKYYVSFNTKMLCNATTRGKNSYLSI